MGSSAGGSEQLPLFDFGGVDLAKLRARRESLRAAPRAAATVRGYGADWKSFERWCADAGRDSLPATTETVSLYVTWLLTEAAKRVSTARRHIAAVADAHRRASLPAPAMHEPRAIATAVQRERLEQPAGKAALDVPDLGRFSRGFDVATNKGCRDRAIVILGFATSLRRSELARLQLSDVSFQKEGLAVLVRRSKTDQRGAGRLFGVWAGRRASTDPVRVLQSWIERRGRWEGPLFPRMQGHDVISRKPICGQAVADVVKLGASRAGLDPAAYAGHSLRSGAVTASADLGRSDQELMKLSGHKTASMGRVYVRRARIFAGRNPLAGVL